MKFPLVRIEWIDACSNSGWFTEKEMLKWANDHSNYRCENVGYLITKTKDYIVVASRISQNNDEERQYGNLQKIPRTWCKITKLK